MIELPYELIEIEQKDENIIILRYVNHYDIPYYPNFIDHWYYDQTEIYLQEMILNFQEQFK